MVRTDWISIVMTALIIAANPAQGQEPPNSAGASSAEATGLAINLPQCRQDKRAWIDFSPRKLTIDPKLWDVLPYMKQIREADARWRKEDVADVTWVDINGDGWCDAITSGYEEPYRNAKGKPVLLLQPREIFLRTEQGFKPYGGGRRSIDFEGSSFTIYWDTESQSAVIISRVYQGNAVGGGGDGSDEFHLRQMLRASFAAHKAGNTEEEHDYYIEVEPFLYTRLQIPRSVAKRIWTEEVQRAKVDLEYPFLD